MCEAHPCPETKDIVSGWISLILSTYDLLIYSIVVNYLTHSFPKVHADIPGIRPKFRVLASRVSAVWASFGRPNPKKSPFRTPKNFSE